MTIVDQTTDLGRRLERRLAQIVPFPDFVESASDEDRRGRSDLPPWCFADPGRRLFPTHTKAACWLSLACFADQYHRGLYPRDEAEIVERNLIEKSAFHGMAQLAGETKERIANHHADPGEADLPDECFAVVWQNPDGTKRRKYPLRSPAEVKHAAQYFVRYRDDMPWETRRLFASSTLDKAASFGLSLPEESALERSAGRGACAATDAAQLVLDHVMASRKTALGGLTPLQAEMLKLAQVCCSRPEQLRVPGVRETLVSIVDQFDRAHGLHRHYGHGVERPEDVVFAVTKSAAEALSRDNVETATGSLYLLQDLAKLPVRTIRDSLGDDLAEALTSDGLRLDSEKAASVLPTLPRPDAEMFDVVCREAGVRPWGRHKAADETAMGKDWLARLAAERRALRPRVS